MTAEFRRSPSGGYQADYALAPATVAPGQTLTTRRACSPAPRRRPGSTAMRDAGIPKLSKSIDWGWFEWFMRPIFDLLLFLFHTLGNFGVAIICLTFIVRAIMFPIAQKQFQSMAGDAQAPAENESAPGALQGRQAAPAAGDPEALPGREDQSGRGLPADPAPDPGLLRALQGAAGQRRNAPPAVRRCGSRTCRLPTR